MPYDATDFVVIEAPAPVRDPKSITDPRERVAFLRDFLRELPPERFDLRWMYSRNGQDSWSAERTAAKNHSCGSAACIAGWTHFLFEPDTTETGSNFARDVLGLEWGAANELFTPRGYLARPSPTPAQAANVLDHYLATGEINWSVA